MATALKPLNAARLKKRGIKATRLTAKFPAQKKGKRAVVESQVKKWVAAGKPPISLPAPNKIPIQARMFGARDINALRAIHESTCGPAAALQAKLKPADLLGLVYSLSVIRTYLDKKREIEKSAKSARTASDKAKSAEQMQELDAGVREAFKRGGIERMSQANLDKLCGLVDNEDTTSAVLATGRTFGPHDGEITAAAAVRLQGTYNVASGAIPDYDVIPGQNSEEDLCSNPIQGEYGWDVNYEFSFDVTIPVWSPTWRHPFRYVNKTFTLAGVSFSVHIDVGYEVSCTGLIAYGVGGAEACASVIGIEFCASCTGVVAAVCGIGAVSDTGTCIYGAGVGALISCDFAGEQVFSASASIGLMIEAPCPVLE